MRADFLFIGGFTMKNYDEAVTTLISMFERQDFPAKVAFSIIRKNSNEPSKPSDDWSLTNRLIMVMTGTEDARTFKQWQSVGRYVKRGAKAFHIFAPVIVKQKEEESLPTLPEHKEKIVGFKAVPVFPIELTGGKEIEIFDYTPKKMPPFLDVAEKLGISIHWKPACKPALGWYSPSDNSITLCSQDYFVYFHELAHAVEATFSDTTCDYNKSEVVAETTAAVLSEMMGISGYQHQAYHYIKEYCGDTTQKGVMHKISSVLNTVEKIINIILSKANEPASDTSEQA